MIITNAKIFTMNKNFDIIENGYMKFENGIISDIGKMTEFENISDDEIIDIKGYNLYPGFVDAHTHLGMFGDSLTFEGDDGNEDTDPVMPHLRAIDAVNPLDRYFFEAAISGVSTVLTGPGSANPVAGQFAAIKTYGQRIDSMIIKAPAAMKFALGENPKSVYNEKNETPVTRMATAALIREALAKAKRYYKEKKNYEKDSENYDNPEFDMKYEAFIPLFEHKISAHFHCHRADDIFTAIRISKEFDIDYVIVHGTDGHMLCDELKKDGVCVLSGPFLTDRSKPELKNLTTMAPGILSENDIPTAIITDHPETPIQYLTICAAVAVRDGMSEENALLSITRIPAEICGIADRVGSLEKGKDADFSVFRNSPLNIAEKPLLTAQNGFIIMSKFQ